jgi:aminopeptidase YwaD
VTALFYAVMHYVIYARVFDAVFPSSEGLNVAGVLEPAGKATQQVVVVGHHDSPHVLSFLSWAPRLAFLRFLLGILSSVYLTASLIAASMAITVAEHFSCERRTGNPLERTRLIVLSTDGEEVGQRGAIHRAELLSIPTFVLTIDSVYRLEDLAVCTRDRNFTTTLSRAMAHELVRIAAARGLQLRTLAIPFGGGGTDAAAFAAAGISATSVIGLPTGLFSRSQWYHTEKDTVDKIEPRAVEATIEILVDFVRGLDEPGGAGRLMAPGRDL